MPGPFPPSINARFNGFKLPTSVSYNKANTRFNFFDTWKNYYKCFHAPFINNFESEMTNQQKIKQLEEQVGDLKFKAEFMKGHMPPKMRAIIVTKAIILVSDWINKAVEENKALSPASDKIMQSLKELSESIAAETPKNLPPVQSSFSHQPGSGC